MKTPLAAALISSIPLVSPSAQGHDEAGVYVRLFGAATFLADGAYDSAVADADASYGAGFAAGAALGWAFDRNLSVELDYVYRSNDLDDAGAVASGGDVASVAIMGSVYWRFADLDWGATPYVGLGLGYFQEIDSDVEGGAFAATEFSGDAFGGQLVLGVEAPLSDRWSIAAEARYARAFDVTLKSNAGERLSIDYAPIDLGLALSYRF